MFAGFWKYVEQTGGLQFSMYSFFYWTRRWTFRNTLQNFAGLTVKKLRRHLNILTCIGCKCNAEHADTHGADWHGRRGLRTACMGRRLYWHPEYFGFHMTYNCLMTLPLGHVTLQLNVITWSRDYIIWREYLFTRSNRAKAISRVDHRKHRRINQVNFGSDLRSVLKVGQLSFRIRHQKSRHVVAWWREFSYDRMLTPTDAESIFVYNDSHVMLSH